MHASKCRTEYVHAHTHIHAGQYVLHVYWTAHAHTSGTFMIQAYLSLLHII